VYVGWLNRFAWFVARTCPEGDGQLGALAVNQFFAHLTESKLKPSSRHQAWRTLKTFFRWAIGRNLLPAGLLNALEEVQPMVPQKQPPIPTDEEVRTLLRPVPPSDHRAATQSRDAAPEH
jgi:site-specific recombinase XerD